MPPLPRTPSPHPIPQPHKPPTGIHRVVPVRVPLYHAPVHVRPPPQRPVAAAVKRAERVAEGRRGRREEGRREGARRALGEEGEAGGEAEGDAREGGWVEGVVVVGVCLRRRRRGGGCVVAVRRSVREGEEGGSSRPKAPRCQDGGSAPGEGRRRCSCM